MSKSPKYVPKHRNVPSRTVAKAAPQKVLRTSVMLSSVAVAATGIAVSGGVLSSHGAVSNAAAHVSGAVGPTSAAARTAAAARLSERSDAFTSRSADRRAEADPVKKAALSQSDGPAITRTEDVSQADPRAIAKALLPQFGFSQDQFPCLDSLYTGESGWRVDADNPTSSAYGIPQALPGSKMASAGADWATNPETQIRWGLGYIADRYGSPCGAMSFKSGHGWY